MSNAQRDYLKDFDYRAFKHTASASQFDTFLTCPRKWWFQKVARMPEKQQQAKFEFGDRLHEACERWLLGDNTGRGEDGQPIELWPDGWDEGLEPAEAAILRQIVEKGIEQGVLRRTPGREIEKPIGQKKPNSRQHLPRQVVPGVGVCGYRDVSAPGLVEDHKSVKRRSYMKSQRALKTDPQMLLYAAIDLIEGYEHSKTIRDKVTLRHNQFCKDPDDPYVRACEVEVPASEVQDFWDEQLEPAARDMLRYKQSLKDPNKWSEVEGPRVKGACRKYGGCPFADICGNAETPAGYKARIDRYNANLTEPDQENEMGVFDRFKDQPRPDQNAAKEQPAPATNTAEPEPKQEPPKFDPPPPLSDTPPWANENCKACSGSGFNRNGHPCAACDRVAEKNGEPRASSFDLELDDEGYMTWTRTADGLMLGRRKLVEAETQTGEATKPLPEEQEEIEAQKKAEKSKKKSKFDSVAPPREETHPPPGAVAAKPKTLEPTKEKSKGGRPRIGFLLVYGSVRRAKMNIINLSELFSTYANELAEAQGASSFYMLDRFKRRDLMADKAKAIAETIPSATLVLVRSDDPDIKSFAAAIEPYASNVIEGLV